MGLGGGASFKVEGRGAELFADPKPGGSNIYRCLSATWEFPSLYSLQPFLYPTASSSCLRLAQTVVPLRFRFVHETCPRSRPISLAAASSLLTVLRQATMTRRSQSRRLQSWSFLSPASSSSCSLALYVHTFLIEHALRPHEPHSSTPFCQPSFRVDTYSFLTILLPAFH